MKTKIKITKKIISSTFIYVFFPVQGCQKNIEMQFFISMKVKYHHEIQINIGIDSYQASKIIIIDIGKCNMPPQVKVDAHQHWY